MFKCRTLPKNASAAAPISASSPKRRLMAAPVPKSARNAQLRRKKKRRTGQKKTFSPRVVCPIWLARRLNKPFPHTVVAIRTLWSVYYLGSVKRCKLCDTRYRKFFVKTTRRVCVSVFDFELKVLDEPGGRAIIGMEIRVWTAEAPRRYAWAVGLSLGFTEFPSVKRYYMYNIA